VNFNVKQKDLDHIEAVVVRKVQALHDSVNENYEIEPRENIMKKCKMMSYEVEVT